MGDPVTVDWTGKRSTRQTIIVQSGTGRAASTTRVSSPDGRVGFAPFVLRPTAPGDGRVAVVLPTNTWQAYNLRDTDGDGWGDTWYAGGIAAGGARPALPQRGVPPRFKQLRPRVPALARADAARRRRLRRRRPRAVRHAARTSARSTTSSSSPATREYVTRTYDVVERYRDLGGNLLFLSANNFFWKVEKRGRAMRRIGLWRDARPAGGEALGIQYLANDDGTRQRPFFVRRRNRVAVAVRRHGSRERRHVRRVRRRLRDRDRRAPPVSPPGTTVLAEIPNLFGRGSRREMTYYETAAGARVFAAGALDFGGAVHGPGGCAGQRLDGSAGGPPRVGGAPSRLSPLPSSSA